MPRSTGICRQPRSPFSYLNRLIETQSLIAEGIPVSHLAGALARAIAHREAGEQDVAERLFEQILRVDPLYGDAWIQLGLSHRSAGRLDEAADCLSRAVSCDPSNAQSLHELAVVCRE